MQPNHSSHHPAPADERYKCGTLTYTKIGLFALFGWLLWGDFCFMLMETVGSNIFPLMLKHQGASDIILSIFITTIPSVQNFVLNPIISTASDRYRGKRGRRIPFLIFGTPFICLFLLLLGFSHEIGSLLHGLLSTAFPHISAISVGLGLLCVLLVTYRFFELFVNTVFWYLFNDVVPAAFMGRFLGLFRVVTQLSSAFFNFFLLKHALTHTGWIFAGAALVYGTAFMLMSFNIKEGSYPPPEPMAEKTDRGWRFIAAYIRSFVVETCSHRIYRLAFGYNACLGMMGAIGAFSVFMVFSLGLTLDDLGKIGGVASLVGAAMMYPVGSLIDRLHPVRVLVAAQFGCLLMTCFNLVFFFNFSRDTTFWLYAASAGILLPFSVCLNAAVLPFLMRIFPQAQFGQFCAANAMCACIGTIIGGVAAGLFLQLCHMLFPKGDYYYRFIPVWSVFFFSVGLAVLVLTYREWKKLGGDESYHPPKVHK